MEYIMGGTGSLFDPELVFLFTRKVAAYPLGTCVRLSNGATGIVIKNYEDVCMRPKIKQIVNEGEEKKFIDLRNDRNARNVIISEILKM